MSGVDRMSDPKSKSQLDKELNEALKETFPGSDSIAIDATEGRAIRPEGRRPPEIDKGLVAELSRKTKQRRKP
jgi:hypothetical protein